MVGEYMWCVKCHKRYKDGSECGFSFSDVKKRRVKYAAAKHSSSTGHRCGVMHATKC